MAQKARCTCVIRGHELFVDNANDWCFIGRVQRAAYKINTRHILDNHLHKFLMFQFIISINLYTIIFLIKSVTIRIKVREIIRSRFLGLLVGKVFTLFAGLHHALLNTQTIRTLVCILCLHAIEWEISYVARRIIQSLAHRNHSR